MVDRGTGFPSNALEEWAYRPSVTLDVLHPGRPVETAFIESFNGRLRDECLNVYSFESLPHAQAVISAWRDNYNDRRPTARLELTPSDYAQQRQRATSQRAPTPTRSRLVTGSRSIIATAHSRTCDGLRRSQEGQASTR